MREENLKRGIEEMPSPDEFQGELHLGHNPNDALGYYYSPDDETRGANNKTRLIESVQLQVAGGKGGNGCISCEVLSPGTKRPDGGNGGRGGHVYILADRALTSLKFTTYHYNAGNGAHGGSEGLTGARGKDVHIRVPVGTVVSEKQRDEMFGDEMYDWGDDDDEYSDEEEEEEEEEGGKGPGDAESDNKAEGAEKSPAAAASSTSTSTTTTGTHTTHTTNTTNTTNTPALDGEDPYAWAKSAPMGERPSVSRRLRIKEYEAEQQRLKELHEEEAAVNAMGPRTVELNSDGDILCVAKGGMFGFGNKRLKGSDRGKSGLNTKNPGEPGSARSVFLELKLIADVGLVGYPNAGKSSLLRALSNARPKVAPYPFTTLRPFMGVIEYSDNNNVSVADIPGIIEGAAENRGLGHDFLKHVVRTQMLLYVIDGAGGDGHVSAKSPLHEFQSLQKELELYDETLLRKPAMIFLNKMDLYEALSSDTYSRASRQQKELITYAAQHGLQVITGSAHVGLGIGELASRVRTVMEGAIRRNRLQAKLLVANKEPRQKHAPTYFSSSR